MVGTVAVVLGVPSLISSDQRSRIEELQTRPGTNTPQLIMMNSKSEFNKNNNEGLKNPRIQ